MMGPGCESWPFSSGPGLSAPQVSVLLLSPATLAMDQPAGLQVDYIFRGVEHAVRVVVSGQVLELEVEDRMTADQWRGEFDASFIEDLTHKTGNFKQFNIFCNMLESALTQSSESVTLDLLTYTDLESLRNRKLGSRPGTLAPRSAQLNSKRYLILIYSVEFDRIHYPLPLPYQGKPDPVVLQGIIRSLKEELGRLRGLDTCDTRDTRDTELWHLREQAGDTVVPEPSWTPGWRQLRAGMLGLLTLSGDPTGVGEARAGGATGPLAGGGAGRAGGAPRGRAAARAGARPGAGAAAGARPRTPGACPPRPGLPPPGQGARGGEGVRAQPARPAEDFELRAGLVQKGEADSAGARGPGGPGVVAGALHITGPWSRPVFLKGERPRDPGSGPTHPPLAFALRWARTALRPHSLRESQGEEAEGDPDEAAAAAEPIRQWRKWGRPIHVMVSPGPAPCCCDQPRRHSQSLPPPQLLSGQYPQPLLLGQLLQRVGFLRVTLQRPSLSPP
ncbi:coiled-coil domain-containing protein 61 isoform X3 [Octodon degus]|uniref:Centrosomal protein CCDC61 n=1 Tax=Octodon degus TaxID=10160 RepID=A0A6P6DJN1_OCTDE|nr:coiled-coil domain-containing protein 61 isoform X3 [Octodon degus]